MTKAIRLDRDVALGVVLRRQEVHYWRGVRQSSEKKNVKGSGYHATGQTVPVQLDTGHVSNSDLEDVQFQTAPVHAGEGELLAVKDKGWGFKS